MLVAKKILQSALAFIVSVGMVLTLTPAMAWGATEGSGTVGRSERVTVDSSGAVGYGTTAIIASVYHILGKFIEITAPENYESVADAIAAITGTNSDANKNHEIVATIKYSKDTPVPADGDKVTFKVSWSVKQLGVYNEATGLYADRPGPESVILVKSYDVPKADLADEITADLKMDFAGDADAVGRLRQAIHSDNTVYEIRATLDDGDTIATTVSIVSGYKYATMDEKGNIEAPVDWTITLPGTTIESNTNIAGYFKPGTTLTTTKANSALDATLGSAFQELNSTAVNNEPTELIEEAVAFEVVKKDNDAWPPYLMGLTVHLTINTDTYNKAVGAIDKDGNVVEANKDKMLKAGDTINVYWLNPNTKVVETLQARVVTGVDANGDGLSELAAEVTISGTGANLGVFAVGYPTTETYEMTTQVEGPGSIFPVLSEENGNTTLSCALPQPIVVNPLLPGYVVGSVTIVATDKDGHPVELKELTETVTGTPGNYTIAGPLVGNTVTINPETMGIQPGYKLAVTAHFIKSPYTGTSKVTINAVVKDAAKGKVTATYSTMGSTEQSKVTVVAGMSAGADEMANTSGELEMVSNDGVYLEFNPSAADIFDPTGATYRLESLTVNDQAITVDGLAYFLPAIPENAVIVATFAEGAASENVPSYEVTAESNLSNPDDAPTGAVPAEIAGAGSVNSGNMASVVAKNLSKGKDKYILTSVKLYPEGQEATESGEDTEGNPITVAPGILLYQFDPANPEQPADPNLISVTDAQAVVNLYNIVSNMRVVFTYTYVEADPLATLTIPADIEDGTTVPVPGSDPIKIYDDATDPVTVTITPNTDYEIDKVEVIQKGDDGTETKRIDLADESTWPTREDGTKINPLVPVDPSDPSKGVTVNFVSDPEREFGEIFEMEIEVPGGEGEEPTKKTIVVVNIAGDTTLEPTFVSTKLNVAKVTALSSTIGDPNPASPLTNESLGGTVSPAEVEVPYSASEPGEATFTVIPKEGYAVDTIVVAGGTTGSVTVTPNPATDLNNSGSPTFTITGITEDITVTVTFKTGTHEELKDTFNITTADVAHGTISPEERVVYRDDEPVFNLIPATGYKIGVVVVEYPDPDGGESGFVTLPADAFTIPGEDGLGNGSVKLPPVTQDAIVHASFVTEDTNTTDPTDPSYDTGLRYVKITKEDPSNNAGNTVDPLGMQLCAVGTTLTMTPKFASADYSIESWTIDGTTQTSSTYEYKIDSDPKAAMKSDGAVLINFKFKKTVTATIPGNRVDGENATTIEGGKISTSVGMTTDDDGVNTITVPEKGAANAPATITLTPEGEKVIGEVAIVVDDPEGAEGAKKTIDISEYVNVADNGTGTLKIAYKPGVAPGTVEFDEGTGTIYVGEKFELSVSFDDPDVSKRLFAPIKGVVDGDATLGSLSPTDTAAYFETGTESQGVPDAVAPVPGSATISVFPEEGKSVDTVVISYEDGTHAGLKVTVDGTTEWNVTNGANIADLVNALNNSTRPKITVTGVLNTAAITITVKFKNGAPATPPEDMTHEINTHKVEGDGVIVPSAPLGEPGVKVYDGDSPVFQLEPGAGQMVGSVWVEYITEETVGEGDAATTTLKHTVVKGTDDNASDYFELSATNGLTLKNVQSDAVIHVAFVEKTNAFEPGKDPDPNMRWVDITIGEGGTAAAGCQETGVYSTEETVTLKFTVDAGYRFSNITNGDSVVARYDDDGNLVTDVSGATISQSAGVITFVYPKGSSDLDLVASFDDESNITKYVKVPSNNITIKGAGAVIEQRETDGGLRFVANDNANPEYAKGDDDGNVTLTIKLNDGMMFDPSNPVEYTDKDGNTHKVPLIAVDPTNGTYQIKIPANAITADHGPTNPNSVTWTSDFKLTINTMDETSTERPDYQRINIRILGEGKVTPSAKAEGDNNYISYVVSGGDQTLNFIPDNGWWLQSVLIDGVLSTDLVLDNGYSHTFTNLKRDVWIDVTFANESVTPPPENLPEPGVAWPIDIVVVNGGAGGQIIPTISSTEVYDGNAFSLIAEPNAGYTMKAYLKSATATQPAELTYNENTVTINPVERNYTNGSDGPLYIEFVEAPVSKYASVDISITNEKEDTVGHPYGTVSPFGHLTWIAGAPLTISTEPSIENGYTLDKIVVKKDGSADITYVPDYASGASMEQLLAYTIPAVEDGMKVEVTFRVRMNDEPEPIVDYCDINVKYDGNGYGSAEPESIHAVKNSDNTISLLPVVGSQVTNVRVLDASGAEVASGPSTWSLSSNKETVAIKALADYTVIVTFTKNSTVGGDPEDENYYTVRMVWSTYVKNSDGSYSYSNDFKAGGTVAPAVGAASTATGKTSPVTEVRVPSGGSATFSLFNKQDFKAQVALSPDLTDGGAIDPDRLTLGDPTQDKSYWETPGYTAFNITSDMVLFVRFVSYEGNPETMVDPNNTITATSSVGGKISPSGTVPVAKGANATFSMEPDKGYELSYLIVDGKVIYPGDVQGMQYTFKNVQDAHTIKAVFKKAGTNPEVPEGLTQITVNPVTNGTVDPVGQVTVPAGNGQNFPISVVPSYGYELDTDNTSVTGPDGRPLEWHVDKDTGNIIIPNLPEGKVNVDIKFRPIEGSEENPPAAPDYARLTTVVRNVGTATGQISYGPGTTYLEKFAAGTNLSISIAPANDCIAGEIVIEPTKGPKRTITTTASGTTDTIYTVAEKGYFTVTADELNSGVTVTVTFRPLTDDEKKKIEEGNLPKPLPEDKFANVKLSKKGLGTINPDGDRKVAPGTSLMVTMIPSTGYELSEFTVNKTSMMDKLGVGSAAQGNGVQSMMYKLNVPADGGRYDVVATFTHTKVDPSKIHKVTTKITGTNTTGKVSPLGTYDVPDGGSLPVFMYPIDGYKIAKITIDRHDGKAATVIENYKSVMYTVSNVKTNVDVEVTFMPIDPNDPDDKNPADGVDRIDVIVKDSQGGKVSPSGNLDVPKGAVIDFNIMPDNGKAVQAVVINGKRIPIKPGTTTYPIRFDDSVLDENGKCTIEFEFVDSDQAVDPNDPDGNDDLFNVNVNVNVSVNVDVNVDVNGVTNTYGPADCDVTPKPLDPVKKGGDTSFVLLPAAGWTIEDVSIEDPSTANDISVAAGANGQEPIETQKMVWDDTNKKWVATTTSSRAFASGSMGAMAADGESSGIKALASSNQLVNLAMPDGSVNGVFYSAYTATLSGIKADTNINVTMIPIYEFCKKYGVPTDNVIYHKYLTHNVTIDSVGGGTVVPFGNNKVLNGQSMTLKMTPFASYYIASVEVTRGGVKEDVTNRVLNGELTLENITSDTYVLVTFEKVGLAKLVNVFLNSAKVEVYDPDTGEVIGDPVDVDLSDVVVGTDQTSGKINPLNRDSDNYLLGSDGERIGYVANSHNMFYFDYTKWDYPEGSMLDGMDYVLKSVDYAGEPQNISAMNVYPSYTNAKLPVTGGFDVVFRLAKTDSIPDAYKIYPSVEGEGGRISPSAVQSVEPGGSVAFAFMPEDHWMVDEVVVKNRDTDEERTLAASEYTNGGVYSYTFVNVNANYDIVVSFCEAIYLTTDWEQTHGFIAPNGKGGGDLRVKKGSSVEFLIAPYSNNENDYYDVKTATFDEDRVEVTQRKAVHDEFKQSQVGANRLEGLTKLKAESAKDGMKIGNLTRGVSSSSADSTKTPSELSAMDAAAPAENFGLNMKPLGSAYKTVYTYETPTLTGDDSTLAVEFERTQLATDTFTLTALVDGEGGKASPTTLQVRKGESGTFNFIPDSGYNVGQIKIDDGQYIPYRATSYTFTNVQMDQTVTVKFARSLGSGSYIDRVSKTVGSMLRTGDLNNVVLAALIGVAALAFLITGLSIVRKNKKRRQEE